MAILLRLLDSWKWMNCFFFQRWYGIVRRLRGLSLKDWNFRNADVRDSSLLICLHQVLVWVTMWKVISWNENTLQKNRWLWECRRNSTSKVESFHFCSIFQRFRVKVSSTDRLYCQVFWYFPYPSRYITESNQNYVNTLRFRLYPIHY